jgi:hypothetical protein
MINKRAVLGGNDLNLVRRVIQELAGWTFQS